jgi:septum formation protein
MANPDMNLSTLSKNAPMTALPFVLASASPARRRLLEMVGITPIVQPSHFDESQITHRDPGQLVQALAQAKATVVATELRQTGKTQGLVMGCDSVLAIDGEIHGKPANPQEAIQRWQQMRGRQGTLYTGHALIDLGNDRALTKAALTQVYFADINDTQIRAYVATGEPMHCAGCFALEGKGGLFVERLDGCHTNVIGLSLPLLRQMLAESGYDVVDFW